MTILKNTLDLSPIPSVNKTESVESSVLSRRLLWTRFWTALLVVLVTCTVAEGLARIVVTLNPPIQGFTKAFDRKYQLAMTPIPKEKESILLLGDSLMDFNLYPELLSARLYDKTGLAVEVRNLASPGNTSDMNLFLLKQALHKGIQPKLVVYNLYPRLFNVHYLSSPAMNGESQFGASYLGSCLFPEKLSLFQQVDCSLKQHSYLLRHRSYFKVQLTSLNKVLFKPQSKLIFPSSHYPETEVSPDGWAPGYMVYSEKGFSEKFNRPGYDRKLKEDLGQFQWTDVPLRRLNTYCSHHHIPLLLVWFPEHPITNQYYQHYGLSQRMLDQKFKTLATNLQVDYLNLHSPEFQTLDFHDPDHLNPRGALKATDKMAMFLSSGKYRVLFSPDGRKTP